MVNNTSTNTIKTYHLGNKTDERLLLRTLAECYGCEFHHNLDTGLTNIKGPQYAVAKCNHMHNYILMNCYLKMAITQARTLDRPMSSVRTAFMQLFVDTIIGRLTNHSVRVREYTDVVSRAAYNAAMEVDLT